MGMKEGVLFIAGDLSGDQHAARVAASVKRQSPATQIIAIGGPSLQSVCDVFLFDLVGESVMGFWEPLRKLPKFWSVLEDILKPALSRYKPSVVTPVDFFGFNQHVARAAKKSGSKVVYFIGPQVWASRPGRVATIEQVVDKMLVILPFEREFYAQYGVPVEFVGHPLLDVLAVAPQKSNLEQLTIGLLPGSRAGELEHHLPLLLGAMRGIAAQLEDARFILFKASSLGDAFYERFLKGFDARGLSLEVIRDEGHEHRSLLDFAITCSGTATLENALLGIPMVVIYKTSFLTYAIAKRIVNVSYISLPNILAGRAIVPELIQNDANCPLLIKSSLELLKDRKALAAMRADLLELRGLLGGSGAAQRAARAILEA